MGGKRSPTGYQESRSVGVSVGDPDGRPCRSAAGTLGGALPVQLRPVEALPAVEGALDIHAALGAALAAFQPVRGDSQVDAGLHSGAPVPGPLPGPGATRCAVVSSDFPGRVHQAQGL